MKQRFIFLLAAVQALLWAGSALAQPVIEFNGDRRRPAFTVRGWEDMPQPESGPGPEFWQPFFAVFTGDGEDLPALSGAYRQQAQLLVFEPSYSLQPGLVYRAVFSAAGAATAPDSLVTRRFEIPALDSEPTTVVEQVYPTRSRLPENLLKVYVHFSAPMSRGEAYRRVALLDEAGQKIDRPFLELEQELWDTRARRLTLLFDPGRVKRELLPNREVGSPLREGGRYTLVVDREWPDAFGQPLKQEYRKTFEAGPPDHDPPDEKTWKIEPPAAGTLDPLTVRFPEPMDRALLERVVRVTTPAGGEIDGSIEIDEQETVWQFYPDDEWAAGAYLLDVATLIEDLAGNSLGRAFEVDVFEKVEETVSRVSRTIRFSVRAGADR